MEYRRTMCDLMWRSLIEKQPETYDFITLEEINDVYEMKVSEMGKTHTGMKDFTVLREKKRFLCIFTPCVNFDFNQKLFVGSKKYFLFGGFICFSGSV